MIQIYINQRTLGVYPNVYRQIHLFPHHLFRREPIPLDFWFCKESGLALPLIALQKSIVEIEITFRPIKELYVLDQSVDSAVYN